MAAKILKKGTLAFLCAFFICTVFIAYNSAVFSIGILHYTGNPDAVAGFSMDVIMRKVLDDVRSLKFVLGTIIVSAMIFVYWQHSKRINDFVYRYRFAIALVLFFMCVVFEITGSSIGMWCENFGDIDEGLLLGANRPIRSDEWAVFTPLGISQYYNISGSFPYFSDTVRACQTDVFLEYGQAVRNPLVIFRPFFWGFLFLPPANGMSFFWCGRLIALFVVSFEFGMLITSKKKSLSAVYAFMIAYAPPVQWWFAVVGFVEMLIYTQLAILMLHEYMNTASLLKRISYCCVAIICAGGYILAMYPPWMIPCAYVLIMLAIWQIRENYKSCRMMIADWLCIGIAVLILVLSMLYLWHMSGNTVSIIMDTVYPGKRRESGGGRITSMFLYVTDIWNSISGAGAFYNACESSFFIDFFPLCYILPVVLMLKRREADFLLVLLLALNIPLLVFCSVGFPKWLCMITFLDRCTSVRVPVILGFSNTIVLFRSLSLNRIRLFSKASASLIALVTVCCVLVVCNKENPVYLRYSPVLLPVTAVLFFSLYLCLIMFNNHRAKITWRVLAVFTVFISSFLANPVRHGIKSVENIAVLNTMKEIHRKDMSAKWVMEGMGFPLTNAGLLVGAPTINCTNVYPDIDRWSLLDAEGKYKDIYNRYAHILLDLHDEGMPEFSLIYGDQFSCSLTVTDLRTLDVGYIMSSRNLDKYVVSGDLFFLTQTKGFFFYRVNYPE